MTGDRVAEIRERLEAATPGPWEAGRDDLTAIVTNESGTLDPISIGHVGNRSSEPDADLIANAPADLAYLLAEVEHRHDVGLLATAAQGRAEAEVAALRGRLAAVEAEVARYDDGCPGNDECCAETLYDAIRAALATGEGEDNAE